MAKITISMPDAMSAYVGGRVESGQYGNISEYFRDLVRRDQQRQAAAVSLRATLDAAEASGLSGRQVSDIVRDVERRLARHGQLPPDG